MKGYTFVLVDEDDVFFQVSSPIHLLACPCFVDVQEGWEEEGVGKVPRVVT